MLTEGASDCLHRLDAGAHGLPAPFIEELASPGGRVVIPELLEGFLEKVSPDGLQVVAEQVAQAEALLNLQVLFPLEQEPARLLERGVWPSLAMRRDSPAWTSSRALFIFATIWKRSRICRASEDF